MIRGNKDIFSKVGEDTFYHESNKELYRVIMKMQEEGVDIDKITVKDSVANNPRIDTTELEKIFCIDSENIEAYVKVARDREQRRNMITAAHQLLEDAHNMESNVSDTTGAVVETITKSVEQDDIDPSVSKAVWSLRQQVSEFKNKKSKYIGHETHIEGLDKKLGGIRDGHFGVLSGYTSAGKTALALNIACSFIREGKKVVIFSLEMAPSDLVARMTAILSGIEIWKISTGTLTPQESLLVREAITLLEKSGTNIYEDPSISAIEMTILKESQDPATSLFLLDYLGLVQTRKKSDYEGLKHIAQRFQNIMKSYKIHLLALSQIGNEQIKNDNPFIISTKGSGDIGASADYVLRLKNKEANLDVINELKENYIPLPIQLYIQKNRHGATGVVDLYFQTHTNKFMNYTEYKEGGWEDKRTLTVGSNQSIEGMFGIE